MKYENIFLDTPPNLKTFFTVPRPNKSLSLAEWLERRRESLVERMSILLRARPYAYIMSYIFNYIKLSFP